VKPNRAFTTLKHRLEQHPELFRPWKGTIYRVATLKYPDPQEIVSGAGSYRYGGRWNAIESESENQGRIFTFHICPAAAIESEVRAIEDT